MFAAPPSTAEQWVAHHRVEDLGLQARFQSLTADSVRQALASAGFVTAGSPVVHESWENRVYGFRTSTHGRIVAKVYRPGRWPRAAIEDELHVNRTLFEARAPVVEPLANADGSWVGTLQGMSFSVFAHVDGAEDRYDGWTPGQTRRMGRVVAELHEVMSDCTAPQRLSLHPRSWAEGCLQYIESVDWMPAEVRSEYGDSARALIESCAAALEALPFFPVHGDLGINNLLWTGDGPVVMDFDDLVNGPAVQDLSRLHLGVNGAGPGTAESRAAYRALLAEGYREVRPLPADELELCEALLSLRLVWMDAWVASRQHDPLFLEECAERSSVQECRRRAVLMREAVPWT